MLTNFDQLVDRAKAFSKKKTVVVAGAHDSHALEAVLKAREDGTIDCALVGKKEEILSIANDIGYETDSMNIINADTDQDSSFRAVALIREEKGDILMKGNIDTNTLLKEVVSKETGIGKGGIMSHMCILQIPTYKKIVGFTDAGMVLYPNLDQKAGILNNALDLFRELGYEEPKVSVVSAVEVINPKIPDTLDGAEIKKMGEANKFGRCCIEGPISFDISFSRESAEIKGFESPVAGDVDIMLVPDITVGNILAKALYCLGGAKMVGCVLGAKVPIVLSSRSATFEEKYYSLMLCAALK